jgi:hypothetical protein
MSNEKSIVVRKSNGAEQASAHSKDAVPRRRINRQMMQNIVLIWLDNNIDNNSIDCCNKIAQMRSVINCINTFTDADQCVDFLTNIHDKNVCMIISGTLCENLMPLIHDFTQLHHVLIFCEKKTGYEKWAKDWTKTKGISTEISSICVVLEQAVQQCEQNTIPISLIATSGDLSTKKLDQLESSFMYTRILKEILLTIKFEQQHITAFIAYCREQFVENDRESRNMKKIRRKISRGNTYLVVHIRMLFVPHAQSRFATTER